MSRRPSPPGHFSLFRRSNRIWHFYVYDEYGRRHQYSTGLTSKPQALAYVITCIEERSYSTPRKQRVLTLSQFAEGFYSSEDSPFIQERIARGFSYSAKSARTNTSALKNHVLRYLGDMPLTAITTADVNTWLLNLPRNDNICNKTANNQLTILRQVLDEAVRQELIDKNCASIVKPLNPKVISTDRQVKRVAFSRDQIIRLFAFRWQSRHAMLACILAAGTGMRMGEVRALRVEQIHDDYIDVDSSIAEFEGRKCTKSTWERVVPIDMELRYILNEIMPEEGYIFTLDGVNPVSDNWISSRLYAEMEKAGIRAKEGEQLSFHSFRHYFNTRLVASGVSPEKIRAVIGHESEEMTEHYTHLEPSDMEQIRSVQRLALGL